MGAPGWPEFAVDVASTCQRTPIISNGARKLYNVHRRTIGTPEQLRRRRNPSYRGSEELRHSSTGVALGTPIAGFNQTYSE
jgi:hypothetical protein